MRSRLRAALDWLLCDGLRRLTEPDGDSLYLRLSTRPIDQSPFAAVQERVGDERCGRRPRRRLPPAGAAGGHRGGAGVVRAGGARGARRRGLLDAEGLPWRGARSHPDRLYRGWRSTLQAAAAAPAAAPMFHLGRLIPRGAAPADRHRPRRRQPHLAWLGSVFGTGASRRRRRLRPSGSITDLYRCFDLLPEQIANAALVITA